MLIYVKDGNGVAQLIIVAGQESPSSASAAIATTGDSEVLLAANTDRAGVVFQNQGSNAMRINVLGGDATADGWVVEPGEHFPPPGFPLTTAAWNISGTTGDKFHCLEWSTDLSQ